MPTHKIIVTHPGALKVKYGSAGLAKIMAALKQLVAADAKRGFNTRISAVDSVKDMAGIAQPCANPATPRQAKAAIDGLYSRLQPDYIMILGASDVFPLQSLKNPLYSRGDDDDKKVPSDLPYACDGHYGSDPNGFVGPTRVVGRLPDIVGANHPAYLLKLLHTAANAATKSPDQYQQHFGLSAQIWQSSTSLSMKNLFGSTVAINTCPPSGPKWPLAKLKTRVHFINCHGAKFEPAYFGQPKGGNEQYPEAHVASWLPGKIFEGTVMAAECCYGAEMYDPAKSRGQAGIAYTYLGEGAYGVLGSTTIAYGPSSGNGSADLICQYFLQAVLQGASLGRAALEARQRFTQQYSHLGPEDLKTISQFYLLGDPSIHPVAIPAHALNQTGAFKKAFAKSQDAGPRALRREKLRRVGRGLSRDIPATRAFASGDRRVSKEVHSTLAAVARETGLGAFTDHHFNIVPRRGAGADSEEKRTVHVLVGSRGNQDQSRPVGIKRVVLLVATAQGGKLVHLRRLHSR